MHSETSIHDHARVYYKHSAMTHMIMDISLAHKVPRVLIKDKEYCCTTGIKERVTGYRVSWSEPEKSSIPTVFHTCNE